MPEVLKMREVTGLWSARVPDGPDSDAHPDTVLIEGHVTFEPQYRVPLVYPGEHIVVEPMHAVIHEGVLYGETVVGDDVVRGPLFLPVTVDEAANQTWSWVAKFQGMRLGEYGEEVTLPNVRFQVPAGDDALDLSEVIPVSQSGNTITLRGPGLSEEDAQALVDAGLDERGLLPDGSLPSVARAEVEQIVAEAAPAGGGVEEVSGTMTLDPARSFAEVFAVAAATVEGEPLAAGEAAVFRRFSGAWQVMVLDADGLPRDSGWRSPGEASDLIPVTPLAPLWVLDEVAGGGSWSTLPQTGLSWDRPTGVAASGEEVVLTASAEPGYRVVGERVFTRVFPVAPDEFESGVTYFDYPAGSVLTDHTIGGLQWQAPTWSESGGNAAGLPFLDGYSAYRGAGGANGGGGVVVLPSEDGRVTARFAHVTSGNAIYLVARGSTVVELKGGSLRVEGVQVASGFGAYGELSLGVEGATGTVWHDGVEVWSGTLTTLGESTRYGFFQFAGRVVGVKIEAGQVSGPPALPHQVETGTVMSEAFTGEDSNSVNGRTVDNGLGGTINAVWLGEGASGWSAPALGIGSERGIRAGSGSNVSTILCLARNPRVKARLVTPPTAGEARLFLRSQAAEPGPSVHLRITATSVTPYQANTSLGASLGAPQAGDEYTISVIGDTAQFSGTREGVEFGTRTATVDSSPSHYVSGVSANAGATDVVWDDMVWSAL